MDRDELNLTIIKDLMKFLSSKSILQKMATTS